MVKVFVVSENYDLSPVTSINFSNKNDGPRLIDSLQEEKKNMSILVKENDDQSFESSSNSQSNLPKVKNMCDVAINSEIVQETIGETSGPKLPVPQKQNFVENQSNNESNVTLESEKFAHEENANNRLALLTSIILNDPVEFSLLELLAYTIGITLFGFTLTLPLSFLPLHDIIQYPE